MIIHKFRNSSGHAGSIATIGGMTSTNAGQRLEQYIDQIGERLGDKRRRSERKRERRRPSAEEG